MEKLFTLSIPKTCLNYQIPVKFENSPEAHPQTRKKTISFVKNKHQLVMSDEQLVYFCRNGRLLEAEGALESISRNGSKVNRSTYIDLLELCIGSGSIDLGRILHARIDLVLEPDVFVETKLVGMYAKCGCLADARKVFDSMRERNLYAWSAMIGAYSRGEKWREVVELFYLMMEDGVLPDDFLLPKILQACGNCGDVQTGRLIHSLATKLGTSSCLRVSNSILAVYAKCRELSLATRFFRNMDERDVVAWNSLLLAYCQRNEHKEAIRLVEEMKKEGIIPGLVTWNILIGGYNQQGKCDAAMDLMKEMESLGVTADVFTWTSMISGLTQNGRTIQGLDTFREMLLVGVMPNGITLMSAVSACSCLRVLNLGLEVHSVAVKMGFIDDVLVVNSLIDMYSKCGELEAARKVFDSVKDKDVYTWNSLITGYCQAGYCGKAYELFTRMQDSYVKPNIITWNTMISGYIKNGDEDEAMDLFHRLEKDGKVKRNTATWNLIIAGYLQNGKRDEALEIFRKMQFSGFVPNSVTILSVLPACGNLLAAKKLKEIHGCVLRRNLNSVHAVTNSLIDTYAKSGNISYSRAIFDGMERRDIVTWNSMIGGYVLHGCCASALDLFDQMKRLGFKPNRGTLASIILAHGLAGNVDEGKQVFSRIANDYHIIPALEHYSAMICLYGRSGRLEEALQFIYETNIYSEASIWEAFLTGCRIYGDISLAIRAADHLFDLEPENLSVQNLVLQAYALGAKHGRPLKWKSGKDNMSKKPLGQSWIEVRNMIYTFTTGDKSKLCMDFLYPWLKTVSKLDDRGEHHGELLIEDEETEATHGFHSEKIAFAFGLTSSSLAPRTIRILKNVRMCRDCHQIAKDISRRYGCDIFLDDTKCLHHFKNGGCSCRDYW
ncbi:PREDICTED: pentatricopeptide repeat-containing protein At1g19720 [Tarenaya hassleriana]|uniref:pentatricopeptide repeat-containing protein At1g19720 n=1 Tax=Tarenaya hassleriana TaxID=28532 RepID=UPI00053C30E4|nr:PREDICTED: pentatricopeptide repeat-containing protein At1g19720 [Tarenaya hassleriana]